MSLMVDEAINEVENKQQRKASEMIYLYYAEVSGRFAVYGKTGGLAGHGEDIATMEFTLEEALDKITAGEIVDAKTIMGIFWLENRQLKR